MWYLITNEISNELLGDIHENDKNMTKSNKKDRKKKEKELSWVLLSSLTQ